MFPTIPKLNIPTLIRKRDKPKFIRYNKLFRLNPGELVEHAYDILLYYEDNPRIIIDMDIYYDILPNNQKVMCWASCLLDSARINLTKCFNPSQLKIRGSISSLRTQNLLTFFSFLGIHNPDLIDEIKSHHLTYNYQTYYEDKDKWHEITKKELIPYIKELTKRYKLKPLANYMTA